MRINSYSDFLRESFFWNALNEEVIRYRAVISWTKMCIDDLAQEKVIDNKGLIQEVIFNITKGKYK